MATKRRKGTKARKSGRRGTRRASGTRTRGRALVARRKRPAEAAREVRARQEERASAGRPPALRIADPPVVEEGTGRSADADRAAAELARRIEAAVGGAEETLRSGPAWAPERLGQHRAQTEEAARRHEEARDLPGAASLGLELAVGALRLVGSMATAPLRLGLAFLRGGDGRT